MKNMGLHRLILVAPPAFDPERARWMAPGCSDLLDQMSIVDTLDEALDGVHRVIASTARHRGGTQSVIDEREVARQVFDAPNDVVTAVLFGREDFGLDKVAVDRAEAILRIRTPEHASLNLGQAVLLVAHALFDEARERGVEATGRMLGGHGKKRPTATHREPLDRDARAELGDLEPAAVELVKLLQRVGYTRAASPQKVGQTARASLQKAGLSKKEVGAVRGMVARLQWALDHPDKDWTKRRKD